MKNVVEVKNVVKSFKDKIVLNHVSFSMKPGEIVGFVGQNINVNLKMYSFDHLRMYNIDHINTCCSRW